MCNIVVLDVRVLALYVLFWRFIFFDACSITTSEGHNSGSSYPPCIIHQRSYFMDAHIHGALQLGWQQDKILSKLSFAIKD